MRTPRTAHLHATPGPERTLRDAGERASAAEEDLGHALQVPQVADAGELPRGVHRQDRMPTSTVRIPSRVAVMGPIVEPHGTALFDTNSCDATPASAHQPFHAAAPTASVAYRWFALILRIGPLPRRGRTTGSCFCG